MDLALSYAVCTYETRYWAWPPPMQFERRIQLAPTNEIHESCSSFNRISFQHVRRDGNKLAHSLARRAVLSADTVVWVEELPTDLEDVFQMDLVDL